MATRKMNMQQPDPAGLFDQYQGQRKAAPVNNSVTAQISNRPAPPSSIPPVQSSAPVQQPAAPVSNQPVNPFLALYESGAMEQSIQQAQQENPLKQLYDSGVMEKSIQAAEQENPFKKLYESGVMTQSVLAAEDQQYVQAANTWQKTKDIDPVTGMRAGGFFPKQNLPQPSPPARDLKQIAKDSKLGVRHLRTTELGGILGQIESGNMTPDQDAIVAQYIEPNLRPELKKQLQISRMTRDKYLDLKSNYDQQMAEQEELKGSLDWDSRRQLTTPGQMEQLRSYARGATLNYAFSPDEDRLNSDNVDTVAEERAQRQFYRNEQAEYPVSRFAGEMMGTLAPLGLTGMGMRTAKVAQATKALKAGPPTAEAASVIARSGAPKGVIATAEEGMLWGLPTDVFWRPEGSEDMSQEENINARLQQVGFGMVLGATFDLGLMGAGKALRAPGKAVNKVKTKRLDKTAKDLGYDNFDAFADAHLEVITDETGQRIRLKQDALDGLPEEQREKTLELIEAALPGAKSDATQSTTTANSQSPSRAELDAAEATRLSESTAKEKPTERPPESPTEETVQGRTEPTVKEDIEDPTVKEAGSPSKKNSEYPDRESAITSLQLQKITPTTNEQYLFDDFEANELPIINKLLDKLRAKNVSPEKAVSKIRGYLSSRRIATRMGGQSNRFNDIIEEAYTSGNPVKLYEDIPKRNEIELKEEPPTELKVKDYEIVEAPINELTLSSDVPQFKAGANQQGVVEPLGGTFERTGVAPIQVWVREDGTKEVISGRHRLDLAKRSGEETIPAQYHYESEGFSKQQATSLDATLNIREGQGKVKDYVEFIQTTKPTKAEADAEGILGRATGQRAYTIATEGSDALIAAHSADRLTDEAATRIARAAPGSERLQSVGIKAIQDGKTITVAENMVKAVRSMTDDTAPKSSGDMFGFDDSALKEAERLARKASAKQADIQKTLSAVQGAAKNPELAAKEGVDVKDPEAVKRRIEELKQEKQDWQNWHTNPELTAQLRGEEPSAKVEPLIKTEPIKAETESTPQEGFDLNTQTEAELTAKDKTIKEADQLRDKEQQDLEAKAKADQEVEDFELGIQGSGKDVASKQDDLLGLGGSKKETKSDLSQVVRESGTLEKEPPPAKELRDLWRKTENRTDPEDELKDIQEIWKLQDELKTRGYSEDEIGAMSNNMTLGNYLTGKRQGTTPIRYMPGDASRINMDARPRETIPAKPEDTYLGKNDMGEPVFRGGDGNSYVYENGHYKDVVRQGQEKPYEGDRFTPVSDIQKQPSLKSEPKAEAKSTEIKTEAPEPTTTKTTITNTPDPKAKDLKGGPYTVAFHNAIRKAQKAGKLTLEEYQAAFKTLINNKDEVLQRLNKYTKKQLMGITGKTYAYPKDVKKAEALQDAYNSLLKQYLFGRPTANSGPQDIFKLARNQGDFEKSVKDVVGKTKQSDLDDWAQLSKDYNLEKKKAKAEKQAKIDNPQTLEDYQLAIKENGKDSLTTAQRSEYERLNAESQWQLQEKADQQNNVKEGLETEDELVVHPITEGTHTKTGETIFNVKVETKLGKEKFQEATKTVKSMGGGYWKGNFWLKTKDDAEQFTNWLNGQTIDRSASKMKQETTAANTRANKLRELADKQEQQGNADLNADRRTNTPKQMDQATSARAGATKKIRFAQTLRNIANGIEDGTVRFLSKLSNMTQLDELNRLKRNAVPHDMTDSSYNGYSMSSRLKEGVTLDDYIDKIRIPDVQLHRDNATKLAEELKGKRGYARLRQELETQISLAHRRGKSTISLDPHGEYAGLLDTYVKKNNPDIGWLYKDNMDTIKRLQRMGLTTDDQLRSAIRELEEVKSKEGIKTPVERKLEALRFKIKQTAKNFNDFFPTPKDVVNRVLELADIKPGMKTLEPNAGMGHIAEKLQNAAGKSYVDLVEMSGQLVDYLKTAGHKVTQSDFLKFGDKDTYDRIVMNPPFSKDQDIDHVMHAYDLLKPGGKITAIMSNMAGLRANKKNRAFSEWLDEVGAHVEDLDAGAFKSSFNPTSVNTKVVVIEKPLKAEAPVKTKESGIDPEVRAGFEESQARFEETLKQRRAEPEKTNPRYQAYLDSLEDPSTANNADFMAFTSELSREYQQIHGAMPEVRGSKEWDNWHEGLDTFIKEAVDNTRKSTPTGTSLYSSPVIPAAKQVANMLHLNPAGSVGGAVYGGITADQYSEEENFSKQWWLDVVFGAAAGAVAGAGGTKALKSIPIKGKTLLGKQSYAMDVSDFIGRQFKKIPFMDSGNKEVLTMGKQQQLMKALIERQAEKAGEYLLKNFTPAERSTMADLIEERGIVAEGNLLHRQAKELDDFISYTGKKLQDLDMLDKDIELGGYMHRYYSKHLNIGGLTSALTTKGKSISGSWSIRRGTQEVFDSKYMSQSMRDTMKQVVDLQAEYKQLNKKSGDLVGDDTQARLDDIKAQLNDLQSIEFREYMAPENGQLKSFFMASDEVPIIPGLKNRSKTGLPESARQGSLEGMKEPPKAGSTGELALTDRRWTLDGMNGENGILHRDWTKPERESWGEINDVAYRTVRGQAEVAHDLSLGTFFKAVNDQFQGTKVSNTEIEGWHKVPDTKVGKNGRMKRYGALAGKYVTDDIWKAVKHQGRNPLLTWTNNHPAVKTYLGALGKWKAYKTVYNPVSHMNNSVGNLQMYYLSDYQGKYLAKAFSELRKGEDSALVREARNSGLFGTDWTSTLTEGTGNRTIDDLLEKLRTQSDVPDFEQSLDSVMGLKQWFVESSNAVKNAQGSWKTGAELAKAIGNPLINTARKPINKAANAMQNAYKMEDEFFKMAVYLAERQKGTKPFEAVQAANRYFFDYGEMPTGMKVVRDFPIGSPFISYTYFAVPSLVKTAIEKPEKILALAAALEGINYASMMVNGELEEQGYWDRMADEKELYPTWMKGRSMFGSVNNVSIPFLESYKLGLANANVGGNPFVGNAERSGAWPSFLSFWGAGPEGSNPFSKLIFDVSRNEDWRGNPIWDEGSPSTSEKIRKATNYVYQNVTPSNPLFPGSYHQQKLLEGASNIKRKAEAEGEQPNMLVGGVVDLANATSEILGGGQFTGQDRSENDILFRDALFGSMGAKLRPVRADQFEESKSWELKQDMDKKAKWIRKREREYDEGRITQSQIEGYRSAFESDMALLSQKSDRLGEAAASQRR